MMMQQKLFDNDYQIRSIEKYQLSDILGGRFGKTHARAGYRSVIRP
jgi:hypothetical protein